jgi:hypothetical protein
VSIEADGALLGHAELEQAFTRLGERLVRRGVVADLFVVGGAAMALAYDAKRLTRDVDALLVPHGVVVEEARAVAAELGLPPVAAERAGQRVCLQQGRLGETASIRSPRPAGNGGVA